MAPQVWFWLIFFLAVIWALYCQFAYVPDKPWFRWGTGALFFLLLIGILGYSVFGSAVQGQGSGISTGRR